MRVAKWVEKSTLSLDEMEKEMTGDSASCAVSFICVVSKGCSNLLQSKFTLKPQGHTSLLGSCVVFLFIIIIFFHMCQTQPVGRLFSLHSSNFTAYSRSFIFYWMCVAVLLFYL